MLKYIKRTTAILLSILTIFTMFTVMLPVQVSAVTTNNDIKSYDEILQDVIDEYGEVFTNEDVGEIISYSGYILAKDYAEILYNRQNSDAPVPSGANKLLRAQARAVTYTPTFSYCYDTGGNQITVRKAMIGHSFGEDALLIQVNSKRVYCIEPGKSLNTGSSMTTTSSLWNKFSDNKKRALQLALCCGREGNNSAIKAKTSINDYQSYLATQLIVWEIRNDERSSTAPYGLNSGKSGYLDLYCAGGYNGNIKTAYTRIINAMQTFDKVPSFMNSSESSAPTVTLNADYYSVSKKYNITDTVIQYDAHEVLSGYFDSLNNKTIDVGNGKIKITQNGNQLKFSIVSADKSKTGKTYNLALTKKNVKNTTGASFVAYGQAYDTDWQDLITGGSVNVPKAYLKVNLNITTHGITRDGRIYKSVYTQTEYDDPDVSEGEGALSTSENIEGWYYYVRTDGAYHDLFKKHYGKDYIILGPTNKQGYTQYISEYIKKYLDSSVSYDVPVGTYPAYELGRLKPGYNIDDIIKNGDQYTFLAAFELPEGYERNGTFEEYRQKGDKASINASIRIENETANSKQIGYSTNIYHPMLDIVKSCEDGGSPDGYYFKVVNNETKKEKIVGPTKNGTFRVKYNSKNEFFNDGTYTITELGLKNSNGTYYIPEWYVAPDPVTVEISARAYINAQQAGYDAIQVSFENKCQGRIAVHKTDSITGKNVPNAKYGIYTDRDLTKLIATITTNSNGYGESNNVAIGTYYVQEISAVNYSTNDTVYTVKVEPKKIAIAENVYTVETKDNPYIKLQLSKSSANPDITDNNSCYSFRNAVYTVYTSPSCNDNSKFGTIKITDASGYGYFGIGSGAERNLDPKDQNTVFYNKTSGGDVELKPGVTYYCKETTAPKGYHLNNTVYTFKDSGAVTEKGVKIYRPYDDEGELPTDTPGDDPLTINIAKQNSVTGKASENVNGAIFRVSYYDTVIAKDVDVTDTTPESEIPKLDTKDLQRVWYIETKTTDGIHGVAKLDKTHLVRTTEFKSGDLYYDSNDNSVIPIGSITIEEVQAPNGYFVNNTIFYRKITDKDITISENNKPIEIPIDEQPANAYVGLHKMNKSGNEVANAVYGLYSDSDCKTEISRLTTTLSTTGDVFDKSLDLNQTYYIKEISAPPNTSYAVDTTVYPVTPTEENTTKETAVIQDIYEDAEKGKVIIQKSATDGMVSNLWFALIDETNKKEYPAKKTTVSGKVMWTGLPMVNDDGTKIRYTVKELGYKLSSTATLTGDGNYYKCTYGASTWYVRKDCTLEYLGVRYEPIALATRAVYSNTDLIYPKYMYGGTNVGNTYGKSFKFDPQNTSNPDITFSSDGKTATVAFKNAVPVTDIKVVKSSCDNIVKGFYFDVYNQFGTLCGEICTDEHGEGTLTDLPAAMSNPSSGILIPIQYKVIEKGFKNADGTYFLPSNYKKAYESSLEAPKFNADYNSKSYYKDNNGIYHYTKVFNAYNEADTAPINIAKKSDDKMIEGIGFKVEAYDGDSKTTLGWDENGNALTEIIIVTDGTGKASSNSVQLYDANKKPIDGLLKYVVVSENNKFDERRYITYRITELGFKNNDGTYDIPLRYRKPDTKTCTLQNTSIDEPYTSKWTNKLVYGKAVLHKTDHNELALTNSKWQLYDANTNELLKLTQTGASQFFINNNGNIDEMTAYSGELCIYNIPIGDYYLIETEAPNGYMKYEGKIPFSVRNNGDNEEIELEFTVIDNKPLLPKTGQFGAIPIYIGSAILLLASVIGLTVYKKKRKHIRTI